LTNILKRVALVLALVTAAVFSWIRRIESPTLNRGGATAPVVIAQKDMAEGSSIDRMSLVVAQWPVGTIPAGAFTSIDSIVGRVTRVTVFKGEALVPGRLAPDGAGPGLEVKITPGKRAMSFRVNDVSGIAGLIQANSRVDMVVVIDGGADKGGRVARVFMENMRILAMSTVTQRSEDGRPIAAAVATVEVTPNEGERLTIATTQGQIQLMLRGYGDPDSAKTRGAPTSQIVSNLRRATAVRLAPQPMVMPPRPPKPDTAVVKIFRGRELQQKKPSR
jgi:pilus assembly protein CpaB